MKIYDDEKLKVTNIDDEDEKKKKTVIKTEPLHINENKKVLLE